MTDLISRQALKNALINWQMEYAEKGKDTERFETLGQVIDLVEQMPTIEPKRGRWETEVKPCPFCGSDNVYVTFEHGYLDDSAIVFCNACKVSVKLEDNDQEGFNDTTAKRAVEAWNRRVEREDDEHSD